MDHLWAIVGTGVRPQAETDFVLVELFGDGDGREAALGMDRTIGELPGMGGCEIFRRGPDPGSGPGGQDPHSGARHVGGRPGVALSVAEPSSPPACP
jgi:hypothetical protein